MKSAQIHGMVFSKLELCESYKMAAEATTDRPLHEITRCGQHRLRTCSITSCGETHAASAPDSTQCAVVLIQIRQSVTSYMKPMIG